MKDKGFTLIETLIVILGIGILGAIAAPSWLTFVNQQRANAMSEGVLRALKDAQSRAKSAKQRHSVSFITEGQVPKVAVHLATKTPTTWESLGGDLEIKPGQFLLGTNLTGENVGTTSLTYGSTTAQKITFDYKGNLQPIPNGTSKILIVTVAMPQSGNSTKAVEATTRCIKLMTLLGAMKTGKANECNP